MPLTKEEKKIVVDGTQAIIDRLLAENEELKKENRRREIAINHLHALETENAQLEAKLDALTKKNEELKAERASSEVWVNYHNANIYNIQLQAKLDAVRKAAKPVLKRYDGIKEGLKQRVGEPPIEDFVMCIDMRVGELKSLDKLIGGEE